MLYRHLKTGKLYRLLAEGKDCTNARDGLPVAIYCRQEENKPEFVRDLAEFQQKFERFE